jgi:hypothetical protein
MQQLPALLEPGDHDAIAFFNDGDPRIKVIQKG